MANSIITRAPSLTMQEIQALFQRIPKLYEDETNNYPAGQNPATVAEIQGLYARIPKLYEDEEAEEHDMGETSWHTEDIEVLHVCLAAHFEPRPDFRVFANMNLYYEKEPAEPEDRKVPYLSPDIMIVVPFARLPRRVRSYRVGREGPAPVTTMEVLSARSAHQRDLTDKAAIYAMLGVSEYALVDATGQFLQQKLLLKRLQPDRSWKDEQDADGGITSRLGFRVIVDAGGKLRVLDAATGKAYVRPDEAAAVVQAAETRVQALEAEMRRLRSKTTRKPEKKARKRRKP